MTNKQEITDFKPSDLDELRACQDSFLDIWNKSIDYHRDRALMFRQHYIFVTRVGIDRIERYARDTLHMVNCSRTITYLLIAQALADINIDIFPKGSSARTFAHNKIAPLAKMLAVLLERDDHDDLTDDQFVVWYNREGRVRGLIRSWEAKDEENEQAEQEDEAIGLAGGDTADGITNVAVSNGGTTGDEDDEGESDPKPADPDIAKHIADILANSRAVEASVLPGLPVGVVGLYVAQTDGAKTRLVRLDATPDFLASLAPRVPDPLTGVSGRLRFFRQMLMTANAIVPDRMSTIPKTPLAQGEIVTKTTPMRPANALFLVEDDGFSIASSRDEDTIVVEVTPAVKLDINPRATGFIDNVTRNTMLERLSASSIAGGYDGADAVSVDEHQFTFTHKTAAKSGALLIKDLSRMGSLYTYVIKGFASKAEANLGAAQALAFEQKFFAGLVKKRDNLPITITVEDGALSFTHGKAVAKVIDATVAGKATLRVSQDDFKQALVPLLDLPLIDGLSLFLDPGGALAIVAQTKEAEFRVYLQMIRAGTQGFKERTRLVRIERPDEQDELLTA